MTTVYVAGRRVTLQPKHLVGQGGEAEVYDIGGGRALKLYKGPEHPDCAHDPVAEQGAQDRLEEQARKLPAFPRRLPARVVAPDELATSQRGEVRGYTMRLLAGAEVLFRYGDAAWRESAAVPATSVVALLRDLHATVDALHQARIVLGDFNDLNVLCLGAEAHLVDADSFQFGAFRCSVFTERFVDPRLCDATAPRPVPVRPHDDDSDWYAFAAMVTRTLLLVDAYGGVHRPKDAAHKVPHPARALHGISVFHPEVVWPRSARVPDTLSDDLLHHLHAVFARGRRGTFPVSLLGGLEFKACGSCGLEHARAGCPRCAPHAAGPPVQTVVVTGDVTATELLRARGRLLAVGVVEGKLAWLHSEGDRLLREDGTTVLSGSVPPRTQTALGSTTTTLAIGEAGAHLRAGGAARFAVDTPTIGPTLAGNGRHHYWVRDGFLMRDGTLGPVTLGHVLSRRTAVWAGRRFGVGFSSAGALALGCVFEAEGHALSDGVKLPPLGGAVVDTDCAIADDRAWLLLAVDDGRRLRHRCVVVARDGRVETTAEAEAGDTSWLGQIHGHAAAGTFLLSPTDDGIVRVDATSGALAVSRTFAATRPFVHAGCRLFATEAGVAVADQGRLRLLRIG